MAARTKPVKQGARAQPSPAQQIMMEILESSQVAIVAIFCIGIVCIATYAISIGIIGVFAGTELGKLGGLAISAMAGIAAVYAIVTNKSLREYLNSIGKHDKKH